jgi:hypothetical protein
MADEKKTALVTGASSGIGAELARVHAERGGDLVIVARRQERLEALKAEFEAAHKVAVHAIAQDLADPKAASRIFDEVTSKGIRIDTLINNAGFGNHGLFHEQDWAKNEAMIQVNVTALAALTRLFVTGMVERGGGRILNVASMAGFVAGPLEAVYYATKAFVVSLSESLADELAGTGVTVTALCPGATETEFVEHADMQGVRLFTKSATAREVAEAGYHAMLKGKTILVPGFLNKLTIHGLVRITPRKINTRISRSLMEKQS